MGKYTSGPWKVINLTHQDLPYSFVVCPKNSFKTILETPSRIGVKDSTLLIRQDEANALLAAEAPELLKWAKAYLVLLEALVINPKGELASKIGNQQVLKTMITKLKKIIANANGEIEDENV